MSVDVVSRCWLARRVARLYRADGTEQVVTDTEALQCEDILPGFDCALADIL